MKALKQLIAVSTVIAAGAANAAGPLFLFDAHQPLKWNTSSGPIPVYTDGGQLDVNGVPTFAFDFDGVTAFVTIERADEITQFAFDEWNSVSTSTFEAQIAGTIEDVTGIADVTGANATQIYDQENGYGFFINYDTDSTILSDYFGVGGSVLGIAFPEIADANTGEILEATAVINANAIWEGDTDGNELAGVFTHEFGHAINLSHSQTNGDVFYAPAYANRNPGPRNCGPFPNPTSLEQIETMFPFISIYQDDVGTAQSTINLTDDRVAISNLYPTADYSTSLGSVTGVLRLKNGSTEYSGINVIARNVNDWYGDAVSAMTGDQTQGLVGPDGRFTINGLTPGEDYVIYIENIWAGGYPTTPQPIVSQAEYWNAAESSDPVLDDICEFTPITAEAGVTKVADITFNGYTDGVQYTPIVSAFLVDMAKNGRSSAGILGSTAFTWDLNHGFKVLPATLAGGNPSQNRNGKILNVQYDHDGDGIGQASLVKFQGNSNKLDVIPLPDLNGDSCGGTGRAGTNSTYGWDLDDAGHTLVGTAYVDTDNDGVCTSTFKDEIVPFIWTDGKHGGTRMLSTEGKPGSSWLRAQAVSGNGQVVLGNNGGSRAVAWVNEGPLVDLYNRPIRARDGYAINYEGTRVALETFGDGPVLWNPFEDSYTEIGSLQWCTDLDLNHFFLGNLCAPNRFCPTGCAPEFIEANFGPIPVLPTDMNDEGSVIIGRGGSFFIGFVGGIWIEGLGWMGLDRFFERQGVIEALDFPMDNPISIDGSGDKMVGGLAGASVSWYVDMSEVYVCDGGVDVATDFPGGMLALISEGAEFGRCAFID